MKTRVLSGLVAVVGLFWLIIYGSFSWVVGVTLLASLVGMVEFHRMFFDQTSRLPRVLGALVLLECCQFWFPSYFTMALFLVFVLFCLFAVVRVANGWDTVEESVRNICLEFFGLFYVLIIFSFLPLIWSWSGQYLLLLFLIVSCGDTVAYFVGSKFGRTPLAPKLSPKKTWEGAVASTVASTLVTVAWVYYVAHVLQMGWLWEMVWFAPLGSILGQSGDLFESLLKRSRGVKDSGSFMPGHGGILDRLDGFALTAPVFYFYLVNFSERLQ